MNCNASKRLLSYLLVKLETEPVASRAALCDDLAEFLPSEALASQLRDQAQALRDVERRNHALKVAFCFGSNVNAQPQS